MSIVLLSIVSQSRFTFGGEERSSIHFEKMSLIDFPWTLLEVHNHGLVPMAESMTRLMERCSKAWFPTKKSPQPFVAEKAQTIWASAAIMSRASLFCSAASKKTLAVDAFSRDIVWRAKKNYGNAPHCSAVFLFRAEKKPKSRTKKS